MADLSGIFGPIAHLPFLSILVFCRVAAFSAFLPGLGENSVPVRVRLLLALSLTAIVMPVLSRGLADTAFDDIPGTLVSETLVGLAFGAGLRIFVHALHIAGAISAQSVSLSHFFGASGIEPLPALGYLMFLAGVTIALSSGLPILAVGLLVLTYDIFPIGTLPPADAIAVWAVSLVAKSFGFAMALATPFVLFSVLYNIILGVINKAMPQLMVAFIGAPVITFGGFVIFLYVGPNIILTWLAFVEQYFIDPLDISS